MADTITKNMSIALYRYLCQNIVGTEDHVYTIRLMNAVRDDLSSTNTMTVITSGSFGEGLDMRGSDLDMMYVCNHVEVYEDSKPRFNPNITYFSMEREYINPGFTLLRLDRSRNLADFDCYVEHNGKFYFSSSLYKHWIITDKLDKVATIHGPCITDKDESLDAVSCLHCKTWISPAVQWITRSSNSWPSDNVKKCITKHGVLFVPIGVKGSSKEDLEWRVSFSVGEKLLINTFTHTQLLCYALLKIILKDVIAAFSECKDLLCSYFMKTIVFWISEELPQTVWKPDNIIPCFMQCFSRLLYCVEHSVCSHYFIIENNMFENKIEGRAREILFEKLKTLNSYGWRCILFSDQIYATTWSNESEPHTLYVKEIGKLMESWSFEWAICSLVKEESNTNNNRIMQKRSSQQSSIQYLYTYYTSLYCHGLAQYIPVYLDSTISNNKYKYKQYKFCLSTLLQSIYHDAVSGWLMVASLFYKTKQFTKALRIIFYSVSKCTPEKLHRKRTMSEIHYKLLKMPLFQKKSFAYLQKIMLVDYILFEINSTLSPDELQMNNSESPAKFPSEAYAYFLNFLCHFHLNNVKQCQNSLHCLQLVMKENYLIADWNFTEGACILYGMAEQLLDEKESTQ